MIEENKDKKQVAMDSDPNPPSNYTVDAFSNIIARLGYGTNNLMEGTSYPMTRLTRNYQLMNSLYRSHWIIRKVIDTVPEDMCKNWIKINSQMNPDDLKRFKKLERSTNIQRDILQGLKWGRLYGGAGAVIIIEGHEDILDQPLDYDTIMPSSFKGLIVADRWAGLTPSSETIEDVTSPDFGLPKYYEWNADGMTTKVHNSRIIRFIGRELPYWEKYAETFWGASEVEVMFDELKKRDNTSWNIAQLVFLANLKVMKMDDLGETLAVADEKVQQQIYNTLQAQNMLMSNMGMMLLGEKDEFQTFQYSFAGLNDIYESFMLDISGACEIPVTKLFGRSPGGLSAGDQDLQNYYDTIQQKQTSHLKPALDKLTPIMLVSEFGSIPDDFDYSFNPVQNLSDKDKGQITEQLSNAIVNAFSQGIINQRIALKELKQMSDTTGMFSNITDEDIEKADDGTNAQGEDMQGMPNNTNFNKPSDALLTTDGGEGSGNFGHEGRIGEIGGSGEGGSGSEAEKDCKLKHCSKVIQKKYDKCRENEKKITPVMNKIASELGAKMYGLQYSVKTASSVENKIERKKEKGFTEEEAINSMNDIVRYTQLCEHDKIPENTIKTIDYLVEKGYDIVEVDNKYLNPNSDYKGVHINVVSPEGQSFELQIHSDQSMAVKNSIHPLYEEARSVKTSEERTIELKKQMKAISSRLPNPKGIEAIKNFKKG